MTDYAIPDLPATAAGPVADAIKLEIDNAGTSEHMTADQLRAVPASSGISAAGSDQSGATALTGWVNRVTTVGAGQGVKLPAATAGLHRVVSNRGANDLLVYPASGEAIDGGSANAPITVPVNATVRLHCGSAGNWGTDGFGLGGGKLTGPLRRQQTDYAAAGTTQGTATAVTTDVVRITSGTADQGVVLPAGLVGRKITLINDTASRLKVYPASGEKWGAQGSLSSANVAAYLPAGTVVDIFCGATGVWYSTGLYQFVAGTFGLGSMITNGQGGGQSITRYFTPAGSMLMTLNDTDGIIGSYLSLFAETTVINNGKCLRFAPSGVSYIGGLFQSATPDITMKVANSAGGTEYAVMRFSSPASAVNRIGASSSATGNAPALAAEGSDSNINLALDAKGTAFIDLLDPPRLPSYTVATLPSAASYTRCIVNVSDGTSNKRQAISDGTNWLFPDGAIVS